jgi:hypothetical protein
VMMKSMTTDSAAEGRSGAFRAQGLHLEAVAPLRRRRRSRRTIPDMMRRCQWVASCWEEERKKRK